MTRRCKCGCGEALPPASKSESIPHKKKFHSFECMNSYAEEHMQAERDRLRQGLDCYVKRVMAKEAKKKEREYRAKTKKAKDKLRDNDRNYRQKVAQKHFNAYIRARDAGMPCVSCGRTESEVEQSEGWKPGGAWDCGHYLSVGSHPELRFEPMNAHRQCKSCNGGAGNYARKNHQVTAAYRVELVRRIGIENVEWLEGPHEPAKFTIEDFKATEGKFKKMLSDLKEPSID
jgi:hypothetical protein